MRFFIRTAIVLTGLLLCQTGHSQQYHFKRFTTKNGLPNPFINHIFCDSRGFMWMSTQGGLSRFDGQGFTNYTSREGLPGSDILCVTEDHLGNLWIGTNGFGVAKYDGSKFQVYNTKNGLANNVIYSIFKDSKNNLWFATQGGIIRYDHKKFTTYTTANGLPTNEFYSVTQDHQGHMWFGSRDNGPIRYDGKKFEKAGHNQRIDKLPVFSLYCDQDGKIWAGTPGDGVYFQGTNGFVHFDDPRISEEFISAIRQDSHRNMWIATDNQLVKIDGNNREYYTIENGLTSNTVYSLGFDYDGKLWVGTINGINVFVNEAFTNYNEKNGLTNNNITVCTRDNDQKLLIATAGNGLNLYDDNSAGKPISQVNIPLINQANILTMAKDEKGLVYLGLNNSDEGVTVLEKNKKGYVIKEQIKTLNGKKFSTATGLVSLPGGGIFIGTYGLGVWQYYEGKLRQVLDSAQCPNMNIMTLFRDSRNNIWASFYQGGVVKIELPEGNDTSNPFVPVFYTTKQGLGDNTVHSICEDKNGNIVFGNYENGITVFNGKKFVTYNTKDNLCSNNVQAVVCDKLDNIWVGTNNGLNRITLDQNLRIISIKLFNEANGLMGTEINQNGLYLDPAGMLWIGSNNGLTRYDYLLDYKNTVPPAIALNNIELNYLVPDWKEKGFDLDKRTGLPLDPSLSHTDNHLTFYFQALTIDQVQFSYMLEGLNDEWTPLTSKNEADFTNIPPGDYTFKVKAINSDGIWSKDALSFKFSILPPFWQTWWFRVGCGVLIIAIIIVVFKWRTAQLAREKKLLEEKVAARTHELSVSNAHLGEALEDIKDSIHYAQKIQQSILPDHDTFSRTMQDSFVLFKPKDIVSGDFYWLAETGNQIIYATCDCTGHGVPGGFMTMLGTSFLNEIVNEKKETAPDKVLNQMREKIIDALKQTGIEGENKDGMDMVFCNIDRGANKLTWSAANNGFYIVRNGELLEMKADKQPIGYFSAQSPFSKGEFALQKGDVIYTFTDGYADQFGGPKGKKFKYKQLEEILVANYERPMASQKAILDAAIENWMKDYEQVDDILIIGYRV